MGKTEEEEARLHQASAINYVRIQILDCSRSQGNMVPFIYFNRYWLNLDKLHRKLAATMERWSDQYPHTPRERWDRSLFLVKKKKIICSSDPALSLQLRIISAHLFVDLSALSAKRCRELDNKLFVGPFA
jgi:hypothetical protein